MVLLVRDRNGLLIANKMGLKGSEEWAITFSEGKGAEDLSTREMIPKGKEAFSFALG